MLDKKRIAVNTALMYGRMLIMVLIGLYTSRVVLHSLGVVDYGIYTVIGGVVALFTVLRNPLFDSTWRFLTYELGAGHTDKMNKILSTSLYIHITFASIIVLLAIVLGAWLVTNVLQIPASRENAAIYVLYLSSIAVFFSVLRIPYEADVIAHEELGFFAAISIIESVIKLGIAILIYYSGQDKLIFFSVMMALLQIVKTIGLFSYCKCKFEEARSQSRFDYGLCKELISFMGWKMTSGIRGVVNGQGINILLNIFFGPTLNAARGISVQVQNVMQSFCSNIQLSINPQITKTYASNDLTDMHKLIIFSSKVSFIFLFTLSLPIIFNTEYILRLWLVDFPHYAIDFVRVVLFVALIDTLANPIVTANHATGDIWKFQIAVDSILLMILPVSYLYLEYIDKSWPTAIYIILFLFSIVGQIVRVFIALPNIKLGYDIYIRSLIVPLFEFTTIMLLMAFLYNELSMRDNIMNLCCFCAITLVVAVGATLFVVMNGNERNKMKQLIKLKVQNV